MRNCACETPYLNRYQCHMASSQSASIELAFSSAMINGIGDRLLSSVEKQRVFVHCELAVDTGSDCLKTNEP